MLKGNPRGKPAAHGGENHKEASVPSVTIAEDTFRRLAERAAALNVSIEELVRRALEGLVQNGAPVALPLTGEAWIREFEAWTKQIESRAGRYPSGFQVDDSRETIYGEREDRQL
jgi:hypothetical protein